MTKLNLSDLSLSDIKDKFGYDFVENMGESIFHGEMGDFGYGTTSIVMTKDETRKVKYNYTDRYYHPYSFGSANGSDFELNVKDGEIKFYDLGITFSQQEHFGGEGMGDEYWGVGKIEDSFGNAKFFRLSGFYASYHGADCDDYSDWEEVKPVQVIKTEYQKA